MAKRLLAKVLEDVLGDFISGFSNENLKLGVWGGKIEFTNLVLKPGPLGGVLKDLNLPVAIMKGFLKHVRVTIPWTSLGKSPVKVLIDEFFLQLRPLEPSEYPTAEESLESKLNAKRKVLMAEMKSFIENLISETDATQNYALNNLIRILLANKKYASLASVLNTSSNKSKSYLQRLLTKILDNIEISVSNVHIRYEDSLSIPEHVISAGVTLHEFIVASADESWQVRPAATPRSVSVRSKKFAMRKLFNLKHLCVYCHSTESVTFEHINSLQLWRQCMLDTIYSEKNQTPLNDVEYILRPPNILQVRFNHSEYASESQPMLSIDIRGELKLVLSKIQLNHIIKAFNKISEVMIVKVAGEFRPETSPASDKKEWWRYTFRRMTNNYQNSSAEDIAICMQNRKPYMQLFRKEIVSEGNNDPEDENRLNELETILPLSALMTYQRSVLEQCLQELSVSKTGTLEGDAPKKRKSVVSKFKKVFGIKRPKDRIAEALAAAAAGKEESDMSGFEEQSEGDDIAIDQLTNVMDRELEDLTVDVSNEEHIACRLEFNLLIDFEITADPTDPCMLGHANISAACTFKPSLLSASLEVDDLYIRDMTTPNAVLPYIFTFSNLTFPKAGGIVTIPVNSSQANFCITFSNQKGKGANLQVTALPLRVVVSRLFIRKLADIFILQPLPYQYIFKQRRNEFVNPTSGEDFNYFSADSFTFGIDADAPKIIIPEDVSNDGAFLLIDTGRLNIQGKIVQQKGISFELSLTELTAGLPHSLESCLNAISLNNTKVVKRNASSIPHVLLQYVDINLYIQNEDSRDADTAIGVSILPELRVEFTPSSFARLLSIIESLVSLSENIVLAVEASKHSQVHHSVPDSSAGPTSSSSSLAREKNNEFRSNPVVNLAEALTKLSGGKSTGQRKSILKISPNSRHYLFLKVNIPLVNVIMKYDSNNHYIGIILSDLSCELIGRLLDIQVDAYVASLSVYDSLRPESQRGIIWNQTDGKKYMKMDTRIMIKLSKAFSKKSPLYDGTGTLIDINMTYMLVRLDSHSIMHLRPFLDSFLAYTMMKEMTTFEGDVTLTLQQANMLAKELSKQRNGGKVNSDLDGIKVAFVLKNVSLEVLRPADNNDLYVVGVHAPKTLLESVYCINLEGVKLGIKINGGLLSVDVNVKNCMVEDTRSMSKDFALKELVNTTYDRSVWIAKSSGSSSNLTARESFFIKTQSSVNQATDFFVVKYMEEAPNKSVVKVDIRKTSVFMSIDALLDSLHVSLQNSFAIMKLVQIAEEREAYVSETQENTVATRTTATHDPGNNKIVQGDVHIINSDTTDLLETNMNLLKTMRPPRPDENQHIEINLHEPLFFLLEDPSIDTTQALVVSTHLKIEKTVVTYDDGNHEMREVLDCNVEGIEVFSSSNMQDAALKRIVNPFGVSFHCHQEVLCTKQSERQILSADAAVQIDNIDADMAVDDLFLVYSAGMRYLIAREWSISKAPPGSIYDSTLILFGGKPKLVTDGTLIGVYIISVVINKCQICISADSSPLITATVNDVVFYADGALQPTCYFDSSSIRFSLVSHHVEGGGSVEVAIDFFNSNLHIWEPLVEPFSLILQVSRGPKGLLFNVMQRSSIQMNISGTVVKRILDLVFYIKSLGDRSRYEKIGTKSYDNRISLAGKGTSMVQKGKGLTRRAMKKISKNSIKLSNCLPISFKYLCRNDSGAEEMGEIQPGDINVLESLDLTKNPKLSFQIGNFAWSRPRRVRTNDVWSDITELVHTGVTRGSKDKVGSTLTLSLTSTPVVNIDNIDSDKSQRSISIDYCVYSRAIVIDRTHIGITVKSRYISALDTFTKDHISYSNKRYDRNSDRQISNDSNNDNLGLSGWMKSSRTESSKYGKKGGALPEITKLKVTSRKKYKVSTAQIGKKVYVDSDFRWTHLKSFLSVPNQFISTADSDGKTMVKDLISFQLAKKPAFVLIFVDSKSRSLPLWMIEDGYCRAYFAEPAVAEVTEKGLLTKTSTTRRYYHAWGKYYDVDELIVMGGNGGGANSSNGMYIVTVIDPLSPVISQKLSEEMTEQIGFNYDYNEDCWAEGGNSLCLFHTNDGNFNIGDSVAEHWSSNLTLDGLNNTKQSFEISNKSTKRKYMLSYDCKPLPGVFYRTKLVTVMPRFLIVNRMDEKIHLRQYQTDSKNILEKFGTELTIESQNISPWHQERDGMGTFLQLKVDSTKWSFRGFDINEVGTCDLMLPSGSPECSTIIGHVDVRIADKNDNCSVIVFISTACINDDSGSSSISIKNESDEHITVFQANVKFEDDISYGKSYDDQDVGNIRAQYVVTIPPNVWTPFGWADPSIDPQITVVVGTPPHDSSTMISTTLGILKLREPSRLAFPMKTTDEYGHEKYSINAELELEVFAIGCGRVLRIYRVANEFKVDSRNIIVMENDNNTETVSENGRSTSPIDIAPPLSQTATGAIVTGAVLGTLVLGPIGGLAVGGGLAGAFTAASMAQSSEEEYDTILPESGRIQSTISTLSFESEDIFITFNIARVGVSLIVERPQRRELLSLHLMHIGGKVTIGNNLVSAELTIQDFQLDNYSESALYPVMLHSIARKIPEGQPPLDEDGSPIPPSPAIQIIAVRDESFPSRTKTPHFRYIAARILELEVAIDSATIQILLTDLTEDIGVVTPDHKLCLDDPKRWMHNYSRLLMSPGHRLHSYSRMKNQSSNNVYIEQLILHPISVNVTYSHTEWPRTQEENVLVLLSYIPSFAAVDRFPIQLSSFTVDQVLDSVESLTTRVLKKTLYDLQTHLAHLAGSLAILGRPVGLVKNIGGGVQALFYEPWEGLMKSPQSFFIGIGKGTGQFVSGLVVGTLESSASLVGSYSSGISDGLSYVSMDKKLINQRNKTRKEAIEAARKGILHSFYNAGKNLVGGISGGVTGLVTRPLEEAEKDGAIGFMRGFGIGMLGAAVKPVLGVTDGISSTMMGVTYNVGDYRTPEVIRTPRQLQTLDVEDLNRKQNEGEKIRRDSKLSFSGLSGDIRQKKKKGVVKVIRPLSSENLQQRVENLTIGEIEGTINSKSQFDDDELESIQGEVTLTYPAGTGSS